MEETEEKKERGEGAALCSSAFYSFHCYLLRGALFDDMTFKLQEHELTMSTSFQQSVICVSSPTRMLSYHIHSRSVKDK